MYHITSTSIRSKVIRGSSILVSFSSPTIPTPLVRGKNVIQSKYIVHHQATSSLSMFTMSSSTNGSTTSSSSSPPPQNEQRRPFWATRPTTAEMMSMEKDSTMKKNTTTTSANKNTINHTVNATAAMAGISMEDMKKAIDTDKKTKSSSTKKAVGSTTSSSTTKKAMSSSTKKKDSAKGKDDDDDDDDEGDDIQTNKDYMSKDFIAKVISGRHEISKFKAKQIVDDVFDVVIDGIMEKKQVRIPKLGIFNKTVSKATTKISIQTKEKYNVPPKYRVSFKISSTLRQQVQALDVPPQ